MGGPVHIDQGHVNTAFTELVTLLHGPFVANKLGEMESEDQVIEIPETGEAIPSGVPSGAKTVTMEIFAADDDQRARLNAWLAEARARTPLAVSPATVIYKRNGGGPDLRAPVEGLLPYKVTSPAKDVASPEAGRLTVEFYYWGYESPL